MIALDLSLFAIGCAALLLAAYLLVLALAARPAKQAPPGADGLRFDVVVPAHDEEAGIAATIASLRAMDYPEDRRQIVVVADNCSDATAERARAAGATVLVRDDPAHLGKGYGLAHAFEHLARTSDADAVVIVDADTEVSPNLLRAFAARFERGAGAVQAAYGVRNPDASWRTRLLVIALAIFHVLRSLGRERLGLSAGLRGNGMGFSREALRRVPHSAHSIVEDVEHGVALGEAGYRVWFVPEAEVRGEMASRERSSRSQRRRWERGRRDLAKRHAPRLLREAIARRDPVLLDLALDLVVPPLATLSLITAGGALASIAWRAAGGAAWPMIPWIASAIAIVVYVLRGWAISGAGARGLFDLFVLAPAYVAWKLSLAVRRDEHRRDAWVRTEREARHGA